LGIFFLNQFFFFERAPFGNFGPYFVPILYKGDFSHIVFFSSFFTCLLLSWYFDIFFCFHNEKATQKIEFFLTQRSQDMAWM